MKRGDFLQRWGLSSLKLNLGFVEGEFSPSDPDRSAALELYVELLTRITTQSLSVEYGDEKTALGSVFAVFPLTREILCKHGPGSNEFAKLAIPVLNQIIRPSPPSGTSSPWLEPSMTSHIARASALNSPPRNPNCSTTPKPSPLWPGWRTYPSLEAP